MSESQNPKDLAGQSKAPLHLIPPAANIAESAVMLLGAEKYGAYNWRKTSVLASVYYSAALRHLSAWFDGEDNDSESGVSHLAHVRANMGILIDAKMVCQLVDDRPAAGVSNYALMGIQERIKKELL